MLSSTLRSIAPPGLAAGAAAFMLTLVLPAEATAQQTRRVVITDLPMAEQDSIRSAAERDGTEADELLAKAETAHEASEFRRAAQLYEQSGQLRLPGDERGVAAFEKAGTGYWNADKPARASRAWEEAAVRGLVRGEIFAASQNFMRAALGAQEAGNRVRTSDMAWRAQHLTESPHLSDAEKRKLGEFMAVSPVSVAEAEYVRPTVPVTAISATEVARLQGVETRYRALRDSLNGVRTAARSPSSPSGMQRVTMMEKIHFEHDRSDLSPTAKAILRNKVSVFQAHPSMRITVTGYTSKSGSAAYNMELGLRRATAARDYLVSQGVEESRINIATRGNNDLVVDGPGEVADAQNRRGEFRILMAEITMVRD